MLKYSTICVLMALVAAILALSAPPAAGQEPDVPREGRPFHFKLIFMHHSCGNGWLGSINGGLRDALHDRKQTNYPLEVHDAWGVDKIADETAVKDWLPKFETMLDLIFTFDDSVDIYYTHPGDRNRIVMFKSCYTASDIDEEGTPPGDPYSSKKTIWNYKAAFLGCSQIFREHPDVLWIGVTAPPRHKDELRVNGLPYYTMQRGLNSWTFNDWYTGEFVDNYRKETGLNNVAVFNWFEILANPANHPTHPGALKDIYSQDPATHQSHPNRAGNLAGTAAFVPWFNDVMADWRTIEANRFELSAAAPEAVQFRLEPGTVQAGREYALFGSLSGVEPGFDLGIVHLPLNRDAFFDKTYLMANGSVFADFRRTLNGKGMGWPAFHAPRPLATGLVGSVVRFAYVVGPPADFVSGVWPVTIIP